ACRTGCVDRARRRGDRMRRREFIGSLGGAAVAWPLGARAQQPERIRRVGVLTVWPADSRDVQVRLAAFKQGLQQLGWIEGRNLRIEYRGALGDAERTRKYASELVALAPDVILVNGTSQVGPLLQATRTVPIIFTAVADPVGAGFVDSLARPGGNATGFVQYEYGLGGKWLELLKEIAPRVTRAAGLRGAALTAGGGPWGAIQTTAPSFGVEGRPGDVREATAIEHGITAFARGPNGGLIVTGSALSAAHGDLLVALATRHKLPTVYFTRQFVDGGGLISYGPDAVDQFRQAAGYVDRILKGEKPADLPVQA